jgi:hypothetical protein
MPFPSLLIVFGAIAAGAVLAAPAVAAGWVHPAGYEDVATLEDIKRKGASLEWARAALKGLDAGVQPWLAQPLARLDELMPKRKMKVYWLTVCPKDRAYLPFNPFNDKDVVCPQCKQTIALDQPSVATAPTSGEAGTLYEGWGCSYLQAMAGKTHQLALLHALGADRSYGERAAALLKLFARHIKPLPVHRRGTERVIWTYNLEGDVSLLIHLLPAYELLRNVEGLFSAEDHRAVQRDLFQHWVDEVVRVEEDSTPVGNNMFTYLSIAALAGCALEDADYVDWAFGRRKYSPENRPDHHSLAWLTDHNYRPDGAFWELCSAYHLYALGPNCQVLVLGHRLARQMPDLFPPELYDDLDPGNPRARALARAIQWFTAQAFPDLTMAAFGDCGGRVSLETYPLTAEIGYRYLGVDEVGLYRALREGNRGLVGLVYGADTIEEKPLPYQSVHLASGYVALKREAGDDRLYAGLNAVAPGGAHQHGDRLNLLVYSRDRMLTGENFTRYNDPDQRIYSGASYAHNTVTVDETSQVHGNYLKGEAIPHIETFVDLPAGQIAEAWGDHIYPQTSVYRRALCQFDEYVLDLFRVQGGTTHDWFYHGVGEEPVVSIPMASRTGFEPALYVMRGEADYRVGAAADTFTATWRIPAEPEAPYPGRRRDVFSRVTVAGALQQAAFVLTVCPNPGRHSLMVRHEDTSAPFIAVHEAYADQPVCASVRALAGTCAAAVEISHADGSRRVVMYEAGSTPEGLRLRGRVGVIELDAAGRLRRLLLVRGQELRYGRLQVRADRETSLSMVCDRQGAGLVSSPAIAYETLEGRPVYAVGEETRVTVTIPASLSPSGGDIGTSVVVPGQTAAGPAPVQMRW